MCLQDRGAVREVKCRVCSTLCLGWRLKCCRQESKTSPLQQPSAGTVCSARAAGAGRWWKWGQFLAMKLLEQPMLLFVFLLFSMEFFQSAVKSCFSFWVNVNKSIKQVMVFFTFFFPPLPFLPVPLLHSGWKSREGERATQNLNE